jgi:hypothetical protein
VRSVQYYEVLEVLRQQQKQRGKQLKELTGGTGGQGDGRRSQDGLSLAKSGSKGAAESAWKRD